MVEQTWHIKGMPNDSRKVYAVSRYPFIGSTPAGKDLGVNDTFVLKLTQGTKSQVVPIDKIPLTLSGTAPRGRAMYSDKIVKDFFQTFDLFVGEWAVYLMEPTKRLVFAKGDLSSKDEKFEILAILAPIRGD